MPYQGQAPEKNYPVIFKKVKILAHYKALVILKNVKANFSTQPNNRYSQVHCTCWGAHIIASDWPLAEPTLHTHGEHHVRQDGDWRLQHKYTK